MWPQKSVALREGRGTSPGLGLQMAATAGAVASCPSLTTWCCIPKKAAPGALSSLISGIREGQKRSCKRSFQTKTQDTTQRQVGLTPVVKVNRKVRPDSRGGNRRHLCMERVRWGGPRLGMGKILVAVFANNSPCIPRFNLVLSDPLGFSWNRHSPCCGNFVQ